MKTIIIHAGSPKCGSTYLQNTMLANTDRLQQASVDYPRPSTQHPGNGTVVIDAITRPKALSKLIDTIDGCHADTVLLSHEDLISYGNRFADIHDELKRRYAVKVVVFVRSFASFFVSDYAQHVRSGFDIFFRENAGEPFTVPFEEFVIQREKNYNLIGYLRAWKSTVGGDNLEIFPVSDIDRMILDYLGVRASELAPVNRGKRNPSMRLDECRLLLHAYASRVNKDLLKRLYLAALKSAEFLDSNVPESCVPWLNAIASRQIAEIRDEFGIDLQARGSMDESASRSLLNLLLINQVHYRQ